MLTREDIDQITKLLDESLDRKLDEKLRPLQQDIARLDDKFRPLQQDMARLERSIEAIETMPVPNGRPKTYLSATESHSVTGSRRTRYGYQG